MLNRRNWLVLVILLIRVRMHRCSTSESTRSTLWSITEPNRSWPPVGAESGKTTTMSMSYECVDCNRSFDTMHAIECHCSAKGHSLYECDVCDNGRKFKNEHALEQVTDFQLINLAPVLIRDDLFIASRGYALSLQWMRWMVSRWRCERWGMYLSPRIPWSPVTSDFPMKHYRGFHRDTYCRRCDRFFKNKVAKEQVKLHPLRAHSYGLLSLNNWKAYHNFVVSPLL